MISTTVHFQSLDDHDVALSESEASSSRIQETEILAKDQLPKSLCNIDLGILPNLIPWFLNVVISEPI